MVLVKNKPPKKYETYCNQCIDSPFVYPFDEYMIGRL